MKINILGTEYGFCVKPYDSEPYFKENSVSGYCDGVLKQIVLCEPATLPDMENETPEFCAAYQREVMRHEIVHAYFNESGLADSSLQINIAWARNEEMVDWIALQGPKIYKTWQEAGAL